MQTVFDWITHVNSFNPELSALLAAERGLDPLSFERLRDRSLIGACPVTKWNKERCIAFPVCDPAGNVIRAHCRSPKPNSRGKYDWTFEPDQSNSQYPPVPALVFGQISSAHIAHVFESQWDAITAIERLDLWAELDSGEVVIIATRGAKFGCRLDDLIWPNTIYAWPQNDGPGTEWLESVLAAVGALYVAAVPDPHKDLNDWVKDGGALALDLEGALQHALLRQVSPKPSSFPEIVNGERIRKVHLPLPQEIIGGLLSQGEKGELAGGSKSFKTWALIQQALCIAAGIPWWGFKTHRTNVLFLNLEIPQAYFEERVRIVATALGIGIPNLFNVWHLRSAKLGDPARWAEFLAELKIKCAQLPNPHLTSDPIYKLLGGRNENAAGDVQLLLEQLDDMISLVDGANFFGHHYTKGNQSTKEAIDRGAGSGVFQRDPDTILPMTSHEKDGCFTIEPILRNHAPIDPFVIEWHYPLFVHEPSLDPGSLKQPKNPNQPKYDVMELPKWLGSDQLSTKHFQKRLLDETGMSRTTFFRLLDQAEKRKLIAFDGQTKTWEKIF